jgi:hypothetical protein
MKLIFIDEAGYSKSWLNDIENQRFYVLSAVAIDASAYAGACREIQRKAKDMKLPGLDHPLGKGSEIKAKHVIAGKGWWGQHDDERNLFRNMMLTFPRDFGGTASSSAQRSPFCHISRSDP